MQNENDYNSTASRDVNPAADDNVNAPADSGADTSDGVNSNSDDWLTPEARQALDFDPFTPASDEFEPEPQSPEGSTSAEGEGNEAPQPASDPQAQPDGGTPQGTPQQPQPNQETPEQVAAQRDYLLNLVRQGQQAQASPQPQQQQAQGQQQQAQPEESDPFNTVPEYNFQIPDELIERLNSEDPGHRKEALGQTVQGVARAIHQTVVGAVGQRLQQLEQGLPNQINSSMQTYQESQSVMNDFYGKYPQLNDANLKPLVGQIARQYMQETGQTQWNEQLRDAIGQRVIQTLANVVPAQGQGQQPQAPAQPQQQPHMFGGGSSAGSPRAQGKQGPKSQTDHMADIMNF